MQPEAAAPVVADRYRVGAPLGHGAVGDVYAADDLRLGRPVALKVLRPEMAVSATARRRFEEEARAAARIMHPHVVAVFDTGEHDGTAFIVMERLPGRTLADELAAGPLAVDRACALAAQILGALDAAHGEGVLHRDIKPGNVLLTTHGDAKVADFGIAKAAESPDVTVTGALLGTPAYLAPERIAGEPATPASDIYAVGVLLYEALAGQKPFRGQGPMAVAHAIRHDDAEPLPSMRPEVDPRIVATIERAMAKDPAHRFRSAVEMAAALHGERPAPRVVGPASPAAPTVVDDPTSVDERPPTEILPSTPMPVEEVAPPLPGRLPGRLRGHQHELVLLAIVLAAVAVAALLILALSGGDEPGEPAAPSSSAAPEASLPPELDGALDDLEQAVQP